MDKVKRKNIKKWKERWIKLKYQDEEEKKKNKDEETRNDCVAPGIFLVRLALEPVVGKTVHDHGGYPLTGNSGLESVIRVSNS